MAIRAFPITPTDSHHGWNGMTLRDYFAAAALQGECARMGVYGKGVLCEGMVSRCYDTADAMIAERERGDA